MPYYIKRTKAKKKDKPLPLFDKAGITVKKKPDLKAKLDKEFSLFIRLRDVMPNGYFRCISCGQIKPFEQADCGHYFSRTHLATRFNEDNCHGRQDRRRRRTPACNLRQFPDYERRYSLPDIQSAGE